MLGAATLESCGEQRGERSAPQGDETPRPNCFSSNAEARSMPAASASIRSGVACHSVTRTRAIQ